MEQGRNHDSSYAGINHTHALSDSFSKEEEEYEEENGDIITKTRTLTKMNC